MSKNFSIQPQDIHEIDAQAVPIHFRFYVSHDGHPRMSFWRDGEGARDIMWDVDGAEVVATGTGMVPFCAVQAGHVLVKEGDDPAYVVELDEPCATCNGLGYLQGTECMENRCANVEHRQDCPDCKEATG